MKGNKKLKWCKGRVRPSHFWSNTTSLPKSLPLLFHCWAWHYMHGMLHLSQLWPLPILAHTGLALRGQSETKRKLWQCASAAQQQPKHSCTINTVSGTNPNPTPYQLIWGVLTPSQLDPVQQHTATQNNHTAIETNPKI